MKTDVSNRFLWYKGNVVNVNDAVINILAPTAQFGLNVFEGIPCYWNEDKQQLYAFRMNEHYDRLLRSARLIQIDPPYSKEEMQRAFVQAVTANEYKENLSVRQTLFVDGFGSWSSSDPADMFVAPIPKKNPRREYNKRGLDCCVASWRRIHDNDLSPRIKCGANYINSRYGQREALRNGYDTCIFLNEVGKVSEGPGSCLFIVSDGRLITPRLTDGVLESITRNTIIEIARFRNIPVVERTVDRTELYTCDEAFLCGSAMEITPILSIDKYQINEYKTATLTQELHQWYLDAAKGNLDAFAEWVTPIYER